jgi:hypothetical protein
VWAIEELAARLGLVCEGSFEVVLANCKLLVWKVKGESFDLKRRVKKARDGGLNGAR